MQRRVVFRVVAAALITTAGLGLAGSRARAEEPKVIAITAKRFEFSPREITLKAGQTVTLRLTTEDVTHGFFTRPLGIDALIAPGPPTEIVVTPKRPGRYTTICDRFCGAGHGAMRMTIVVEE